MRIRLVMYPPSPLRRLKNRYCEERSDEAIQRGAVSLDCFAALAMTG